MRLSQGITKEEYEIKEVLVDNIVKNRLQVLGVIKGTKIIILNKRINGSVIIKVRGTRLGIDKQIADKIFINCLSIQ